MKHNRSVRYAAWAVGASLAAWGAFPAPARGEVQPLQLLQLQDPQETIYEEVGPPGEEEGFNAGGVNFDLEVTYLTDYVFRGIDRSEVGATEDAPNLQFDGSFKFDLGKLPHPVAGVFVNVFEDDPVSEFQEIRPFVGFEWEIRPLTFIGGHNSFIFPEREEINTNEVYLGVTLDDSRIWRSDRPFLSPYIFAAYDYDLYEGTYIEVGVQHQMELEGTGITLTLVADAAYVTEHALFTDPQSDEPKETGFQHYDVGLIGAYSMNALLNIPRRYGQWTLNGYLFYTDGIETGLLAETQVWGGVGIGFRY